MIKPIEFPTQYNWIQPSHEKVEPIVLPATVARDIHCLLLNCDDAFRHLTRQCKKGWLIASTVVWSELSIEVYSLDDQPAMVHAMVGAAEVMPALPDEQVMGQQFFLYRPTEGLLHINGLSLELRPTHTGVYRSVKLLGQTTDYAVTEADCSAWRLLRPSEESMMSQLITLLLPAARDTNALNRLQQLIGRSEWNADLRQPVCDLLAQADRAVGD